MGKSRRVRSLIIALRRKSSKGRERERKREREREKDRFDVAYTVARYNNALHFHYICMYLMIY